MEKAPVFVKIDDYKDIIDIIALVQEKIGQAKALLDKIKEIKQQEDQEITSWENELQDVENRIAEIDKTMFEPEL